MTYTPHMIQEGSSSYLLEGYVGVMLLGVVYTFIAAAFLVRVKHGNAKETVIDGVVDEEK